MKFIDIEGVIADERWHVTIFRQRAAPTFTTLAFSHFTRANTSAKS
jgi:hypothetical protein